MTAMVTQPLQIITLEGNLQLEYVQAAFGGSRLQILPDSVSQMTTDIMWRIPGVKEATIYAEQGLTTLGNQMFTVSYDDGLGATSFGLSGMGEYGPLETCTEIRTLGRHMVLKNQPAAGAVK